MTGTEKGDGFADEVCNGRFEYLWQDSENYKRPTKMPAPAYIEQLMTWVQGTIDNEAMLPSRIGKFLITLLPVLYLHC